MTARKRLSRRMLVSAAGASLLAGYVAEARGRGVGRQEDEGETVALPSPDREGDLAVEAAIANRRSRREYADEPLSTAELGQLLWAAQGVTEPSTGHRAAPSAGATYPLELYAVVGEGGVADLPAGVYHYRPKSHSVERTRRGDVQAELRDAAVDQEWVGAGAVDVVVTGVDRRTVQRYGARGRRRYVPMEAGHAAENLYLQAEALDLAMVTIGAFADDQVVSLLDAPERNRPLSINPIGKRP
ncbi:SagB/ThcOx family dehydrogenase [Halomicrococcus gelatinilyticus]|uniref:SagB/ThcOx family dehydrogenase n=1 Tax=Halomicrococcus gelatinilyticus TaxID=1702103 RepID=UPI002E16693E